MNAFNRDWILKKEQKGFFSHKKAFFLYNSQYDFEHRRSSSEDSLEQQAQQELESWSCCLTQEKAPFFGGEGIPAEANVAGIMKHRMFHQTFACDEEKPWLFVGADIRWDG